MKITVKELIRMIKQEEGAAILHTDHSTQRMFIYNDEKIEGIDGEITRAGNVIKSIIEYGILLPALYFWSVQDDKRGIHYPENEYNIHDGKQRALSIFYFVTGEEKNLDHKVVTRINGVEKSFKDLSRADQRKLLNYELEVVVRKGTMEEEEKSFIILNDNIVPLTPYERLKGAYHGPFFDSFEKWLNFKADVLDCIDPVKRGKQAFYILCMHLGIIDEDKKTLFNKAQSILSNCRMSEFDSSASRMDEKIKLYSDFAKLGVIKTNNELKDPEKICRVVDYVIRKNYNTEVVLDYYRNSKLVENDVGRWTVDVHKAAINALFTNGLDGKPIKCDYRRFWTDEERMHLWTHNTGVRTCGICKAPLGNEYNETQVDHIIPWSKGGRTDIVTNAQLVHKRCNSKKGCKIHFDGKAE